MAEDAHLISCAYVNEAALYMAYMPSLQGGGLFVRTNQILPLGTKVNLLINLLQEPDPYTVEAKVVWITPKGAQGNKPAGLGFQLTGENRRHFCNKIETYLAGMLKSTQMNDTM